MPAWRAGRPLKRWRYVGVFTPQLLLCVGDARIGPVPQRWWAIALPGGELRERTTFRRRGIEVRPSSVRVAAGETRIDLRLGSPADVEVASSAGGGAYAWTRKRACVPVRGTVETGGQRYPIDGDHGFVDESAGYHPRHTAWRWSAGVGGLDDGRAVGWNLVTGLHDDPEVSERTVWIDGEPTAVGPVSFAADLSEISSGDGVLRFEEWSAREHSTNALVLRSRYRQPFGTFSGTLPGGLRLTEGHGVMESHDARW
jgi:hypothetical protein